MTTTEFATPIADNLVADTAGTSLMRIAVRLLAHGEPVTNAQLAESARVPDPDLAHAPSCGDLEYDIRAGWSAGV
jgi:alkylmercury lyase